MTSVPQPSGEARIAYVVSRFPMVTETFIVREFLELERRGVPLELFSLQRQAAPVVQPDAAALAGRVHYGWPPCRALLAAQLFWVLRSPRRYATAWWRALRGNWRSPVWLARSLAVVPMAASFARAMEALGVRHVHAHYATHPALAALVVKHLTGIPYSITAHAHDLYVNRTMLREKVEEAAFVVTISEYNRDLLARWCPPGAAAKTSVVRCGVDPRVFSPAAGREGRPAGRLQLICVGSLQEYKGHRFLIEACARLRRDGVPFHCLLVGDGDRRRALEEMVSRLGLDDVVTFVGAQPTARVRELLETADVMVLPSIVTPDGKKEGIPVALMEALAMEVPVVATRISGVPELVRHGETGLLVPERDPEALARAILDLHRSPERRREMGSAGRARVLADYDAGANAGKLRDLLYAHLEEATETASWS